MEQTPRKKKIRKYLWIGLASLSLIFAIVFYVRHYYVYSEGSRVGLLYKFSETGGVFKNFEGEMQLPTIQYTSSEVFRFSVTDEALAKKLMSLQGKKVELHYVFYIKGLPWRGRSYDNTSGQYIVDEILSVKEDDAFQYNGR